MFSDMSFKCRSTSTFSSYTITEPHNDSLYTLYPTRPEKAYGLGIYAPKMSGASFLTPRPSLKTIRSQASLGNRTLKSSPVPPLPVYNPEKYKGLATTQKAPRRPRREPTMGRNGSQRLLRVALRAQTASEDKPYTLDRIGSKESLSSIYSRSVSGDSPDPSRRPQIGPTSNGQKSLPVVKTPVKRRPPVIEQFRLKADNTNIRLDQSRLQEIVPGQSLHSMNAPLQLPKVRGVSTFGDVQGWEDAKQGNRTLHGRASTWTERCNLPPLPVEKGKNWR